MSGTVEVETGNRANAALGRWVRKYGRRRALEMTHASAGVLFACDSGKSAKEARDMLCDVFKLCGEIQAIRQDVFS